MENIDVVTRETGLNLYHQFGFEMYWIIDLNFKKLWEINFEVMENLK